MACQMQASAPLRLLLCLTAIQAGCTSIGGSGLSADLSQFAFPLQNDKQSLQVEAAHRKKYVEDRDPAAMRWLLAHRINQGMTLAEVNRVLGVSGEREFAARWIKSGRPFRTGDHVYRWGPDSSGRSVYLVFRENQLVNYDPSEFE